jgi:hypothetical protein
MSFGLALGGAGVPSTRFILEGDRAEFRVPVTANGSITAGGGFYWGNNAVLTNATSDGSIFLSVWTGPTNSLYIVSPSGTYTNLIMRTIN